MKVKESQIEKQICGYLSFKNIQHWRIKIKGDPILTERGIILKKNKNKGFSDILVLYKGQMICLEVKTKTGRASKEQLQTQIDVRKHGGIYEFVYGIEDVQNIFLELKRRNEI